MTIKPLPVVLGAIVVGFIAVVIIANNASPEPPRPGVEHENFGQEHVSSKEYGGDQPPTSGPHTEPLEWGVYEVEVRDDQVIHNMEHGGIYISYQPGLPEDQVSKLKALLSEPYSDPGFQPKKIVLAPRAANKSPIVLSSWIRSEELQTYDQTKIQEYIKRNLGKSPEGLAN